MLHSPEARSSATRSASQFTPEPPPTEGKQRIKKNRMWKVIIQGDHGFAGGEAWRRTTNTQNPPTATLRRMVEEHNPERLLARLRSTLPLQLESISMFGREVTMPRLTSFHGDPGCAYTYSRRRFEPSPWTEDRITRSASGLATNQVGGDQPSNPKRA